MSISPRSGARGLQRFSSLKYYYVLDLLLLDAAKIIDYIEKRFK